MMLGTDLLTNYKRRLGDEYWMVCEDVFHASLICNISSWAKVPFIQFVYKALLKNFGLTNRIRRMEGMLLEYNNELQNAVEIYDSILQVNPNDGLTWKRKIATYRSAGLIDACINELNKYLEVFQADTEGWMELGSIYLTKAHFSRAAYCYEQLLI